jgi:hypothetical protein
MRDWSGIKAAIGDVTSNGHGTRRLHQPENLVVISVCDPVARL